MIWGLSPANGKEFSLRQNVRMSWGPYCFLFSGYWGQIGQDVRLTTYVALVLRLRMSGAIPLLLLYAYAFIA